MDQSAGASAGGKPETVRIRLLGGFSVSVGDRSVWKDAWRLRKAASLVKLLALAPGHRLHREQAIWSLVAQLRQDGRVEQPAPSPPLCPPSLRA